VPTTTIIVADTRAKYCLHVLARGIWTLIHHQDTTLLMARDGAQPMAQKANENLMVDLGGWGILTNRKYYLIY